MASMLTVRNIPEEDKIWLRQEARRGSTSMEEVVRRIIQQAHEASLAEEDLETFLDRRFGGPEAEGLKAPRLRGRLRVPDFGGTEWDALDESEA
jgi:plasmid stability protein